MSSEFCLFCSSFHKNLTLTSSTMTITIPLNFYQNGKLLLVFPSFIAAPQRTYSSSFWQYNEHTRQALFAPHAHILQDGSFLIALHITLFALKRIPFSHLHPSFICHPIQLVRFLTRWFFFFNLSWLTRSLKVFVCSDYSFKAQLIFLLPGPALGSSN